MKKKAIEEFTKEATTALAKDQLSSQRYEEYRGRRGNEVKLWEQWQQSGKKPEHLEPLLKSLDPLIRAEARKRMTGLGGAISKPALTQQLRLATTRALETYKPEKGKLTTHVVGNFMRVTDFVAQNRNTKYMPKADVERYGAFQNAVTEFQEIHGREPTAQELQQQLGWGARTIKKMQKSFGREAFTDMGADLDHDVATESPLQQARSAFMLMKSQFTPEQQQFAQLHYPEEGERQMSVAGIARTMKIPEHKAYRIKKLVENKLAPIIKGR